MAINMKTFDWKSNAIELNKRQSLIVPGDAAQTIVFCAKQLIQIGNDAIEQRGFFSIALSGGSTPNAIFKELAKSEYIRSLDWSKVLCFWSDERSVPPDNAESNYRNAMESGIGKLPISRENIFRMHAETDIEKSALDYENLIKEKIPSQQFDLIMLGMGEDGHTASLFPHTKGLHAKDRLVIANFVPQKDTWRMSMTYECINMSRMISIYVIGANKAETAAKVLLSPYDPENYPIQKVGTAIHKSYWILDNSAAALIKK